MDEVSLVHSQNSDGAALVESGAPLPDDAKHFQSLWSSSRVSLGAYLSCLLPNRSMIDDCMQEVALLAWQKGPKERGPDEFLAYCMGCAKRVAKVAIRKQRIGRLEFLSPDVAQSLAESVASLSVPGNEADQRLLALRSCLESLDAKQRGILDARYNRQGLDSLKLEASKNQRSMDSIYKQLERIRTSLRNCVSKKISQEP